MVAVEQNFSADGGLLVLGNLRAASQVLVCMTERDARALWQIYGRLKQRVAVIAAPYPQELAHLDIPQEAKIFACAPNQLTGPTWGP
jgi:hypothetical protein